IKFSPKIRERDGYEEWRRPKRKCQRSKMMKRAYQSKFSCSFLSDYAIGEDYARRNCRFYFHLQQLCGHPPSRWYHIFLAKRSLSAGQGQGQHEARSNLRAANVKRHATFATLNR